MSKKSQSVSVWIVWGEESTIAQNSYGPSRYDFNSISELNAFLMGLMEASDWDVSLCWQQFNTQLEAEDYLRSVRS